MHIIRTISIFVFLLLALSCKDTAVGPAESSNPIIPLAVGNRWTYVDSVFAKTGLVVDTFTVRIISSRSDGFFTWWQFSRPFNPSIVADEFMESNDSIYSLQYTQGPAGIVSLRSLEYCKPPDNQTIVYHSTLDGDVGIIKSVSPSRNLISVQAGTFSSALVIKYMIGEEVYRESVAPTVGMVDLTILNNSSISLFQSWTSRHIELLSYQLLP